MAANDVFNFPISRTHIISCTSRPLHRLQEVNGITVPREWELNAEEVIKKRLISRGATAQVYSGPLLRSLYAYACVRVRVRVRVREPVCTCTCMRMYMRTCTCT
jgi:hypothetical protein